MQAGQGDGHGGGRHQAAEQGGDQQAIARADQADGDVGGKADAGDQHHHPPGGVGVEGLPGAETLVGQYWQQHHGNEQQLQGAGQLIRAETAQALVQRFLEAEQEGDYHGAAGGQGALVVHRQAAEQEGREQGELAGQRQIANLALLTQVAGDDQQTEDHEAGAPGQQPQLLAEQRRQATEQAGQAEGADAGDQAGILGGAGAPATLGADQQADTQGRGEVEQLVVEQGHAGILERWGMCWDIC